MERFFSWARKNIVCRWFGHDDHVRQTFYTLSQGTILEARVVLCNRCKHQLKWTVIYIHPIEDFHEAEVEHPRIRIVE